MGRKGKFSTIEKLKCVLRCLEGKDSIRHTAALIGIVPASFRQWIHNYQSLGIDGLSTTSKNFSYSTTSKEMAVEDYLDGGGSHMEICKDMVSNQPVSCATGDRFLKKTRPDRKEAILSQVRYETIYIAIQELHDTKAYPITELCDIAGIQRSSYYKWLNRKESNNEQFNKSLLSLIKDAYEEKELHQINP